MRISLSLASLALALLLGAAAALAPAATPALAMGMNNDPPAADSSTQDYEKGKAAIYAGKYDEGIDLMKRVLRSQPRDADALNMVGFAYRKQGDLSNAGRYYEAALKAEPEHKGALEYQGEMFLKLGRLADARANLDRLAELCPSGCEERAELERAIADHLATRPGKGS